MHKSLQFSAEVLFSKVVLLLQKCGHSLSLFTRGFRSPLLKTEQWCDSVYSAIGSSATVSYEEQDCVSTSRSLLTLEKSGMTATAFCESNLVLLVILHFCVSYEQAVPRLVGVMIMAVTMHRCVQRSCIIS